MLEGFKSYFTHYRAERNATITVAVIILLIICGSQLYVSLYKPPPLDAEVLAILLDSSATGVRSDSAFAEDAPAFTPREAEYFLFNPNTLSDSGYAALGFSQKQVQTLRKYMAKGAVFKTKQDFSKLYFVDDELFEAIAPFIDLPDKLDKYEPKYESQSKGLSRKWSDTAETKAYEYKEITVELNSADTAELKQLKGIGSYYAKRIIAYREKLGGFHSLAQLLEIKKITPETIDLFAENATIDTSKIKKINVNKATAQELSAHPYLSFDLANRIVNRRETQKRFNSINDLTEAGLLNAELSLKLASYLSFE
jgi:DNA uptake protein ComE-like DNA-binding protein